MKTDDIELVESTLSGNIDHFQILWDRYQLDAWQWASRYLKNRDEVEEVVQEAFMESYSRLSTLQDRDRFGGWLRRIVRNISISRLIQHRNTVSLETISRTFSNGKWMESYNRVELPSPEDQLVQQEIRSRLRTAIARLSPIAQQAIQLFYFDQRSLKEIAAELGVSVVVLKGILYRARQKLKKEMKKNE